MIVEVHIVVSFFFEMFDVNETNQMFGVGRAHVHSAHYENVWHNGDRSSGSEQQGTIETKGGPCGHEWSWVSATGAVRCALKFPLGFVPFLDAIVMKNVRARGEASKSRGSDWEQTHGALVHHHGIGGIDVNSFSL